MTTYNLLLVDSRLSDIDTILQSLNSETFGVVFQYETDTYETICDAIRDRTSELNLDGVGAVGILQHHIPSSRYQFVNSESECLLESVSTMDAALVTWGQYSNFISTLVSRYNVHTLDLMACALYSNENWKYVIDTLKTTLHINIRASLDNTGTVEASGNWILETGDVNLTTVYFTEEIYKWKYVLTILPNYFVLRTGQSNWRALIPNYPTADTTSNIQTWGPDAQFNEYLGGINEIAEQFSYFAGYWLNRNNVQDRATYSVRVYFIAGGGAGDKGSFDFTPISNNPVNSYTGRFTGYNNNIYTLQPQQDGIAAGIAAQTKTPTLSWSSSPPSVANVSTGPYTILATSASSGAISYSSSNQSVATISGRVITLVSFGTTTITASQAADPANFYAAPADVSVTMTVVRTPVFNTALMTQFTRDVSHINTTFTATPPANSAFTPNLVSPTFTYSIEYLTNSAYANANLKTAEFVTPSSSTCTVLNTGQCYLKVTSNQNLANFLDVATANFTLLTVRAGYIVGPNVDLSGVLIQNYDLSGTNLSGVNFTNARLINCILRNVNLTSAVFRAATFTYNTIDANTNLTNANFEQLISNNISGTTSQISSTWEIKSGQILETGTIFFAMSFTLASPYTVVSMGGQTGYYMVTADTLLINGRPETSTTASNLLVKAVNTEYVLTQVGITPTPIYKFSIYLNSANSMLYVRAKLISNDAIAALSNIDIPQLFSVSFLITNPILPFRLNGSYIFGPNMNLNGVYFDNNISPKPDLTDLSFVNLLLSSTSGPFVLRGWNFTRTKLNTQRNRFFWFKSFEFVVHD